MGPGTVNKVNDSEIHGDFVGRDNITVNIVMFKEEEREFVVTHNVNIKPTTYFTGRETELQDLRQRIEEERKSVLVSGMGGIGKTHICRKLFEEYLKKYADNKYVPFKHIGYIEYDGDMGTSLKRCLKYKEQVDQKLNQKAAWKELEYLAAGGKMLLFVDNVDKTMREDQGLQRLNSIPGAIVLTSRQASFSDEFEPYRIEFLDTEQCKEIYERIRYQDSGESIKLEEHQDLEYIIDKLVGRHTMTVQFLANMARTNLWSVKRLREELEEKGFCLEFHKDGAIVNIQESYEALYDLSRLTEAEHSILEAFSVFPYIPLEAGICNCWLLVDAGASEDDNIFMGLYEKGWLQFDAKQEGFVLHPVFAQFIFEKYKPKIEKHRRMAAACQCFLQLPLDGSNWEGLKFIPFAESMVNKLSMKEDKQQIDFIHAVARSLSYTAEYRKAEEMYEKVLRISKRVMGEGSLDTALVYSGLADVYISQRKYKKAEKLYKMNLRIKERVVGKGQPDTIIGYHNLAYVYERQGEYRTALVYYLKSYRISMSMLGVNHMLTRIVYDNMKFTYLDWNPKGNFEQWLEEKMKE